MDNAYKEMWDSAEFENKIRFSHLDELLCEIDDDLSDLYVDKLCIELDIEIAEVLGEDFEDWLDELCWIEEDIERLNEKYEVVMDFYDEEMFEMLEAYENKQKYSLDEMFS